MTVSDEALRLVAGEYTREAGVRQLERAIAKVLRKVATRLASTERRPSVAVDDDNLREFLGPAAVPAGVGGAYGGPGRRDRPGGDRRRRRRAVHRGDRDGGRARA